MTLISTVNRFAVLCLLAFWHYVFINFCILMLLLHPLSYFWLSDLLLHPRYLCHHCIISWDRYFTPQWPWWIAHLNRSAGERLLSEQIWSSHLLFQWPGGCFYVLSGSHPWEMSIWHRMAWWAGVLSPNLAKWPKRLLHFLTIRSLYAQSSRSMWLLEYVSGTSCECIIPDSWCHWQAESMSPMHIKRTDKIVLFNRPHDFLLVLHMLYFIQDLAGS